jgi:hypothetical protein
MKNFKLNENIIRQSIRKNLLEEESEELNENRATISSRIVEARKRGLLSRPKYGSFGGRLTAKGKKALGITEVKSAKKGK